jgi:hypothetical protein
MRASCNYPLFEMLAGAAPAPSSGPHAVANPGDSVRDLEQRRGELALRKARLTAEILEVRAQRRAIAALIAARRRALSPGADAGSGSCAGAGAGGAPSIKREGVGKR